VLLDGSVQQAKAPVLSEVTQMLPGLQNPSLAQHCPSIGATYSYGCQIQVEEGESKDEVEQSINAVDKPTTVHIIRQPRRASRSRL
jgi:hypothetical protein